MLVEVALVSEQTLANLIPALHERPERVLLIASAEMRRRGLDQRQRRLLRDHGIEADIMAGAPDADLAQIHEFALDVLATIKERFPEAALVFNATGGNKLMMLGFVEVFRGDSRVIYADTQHGRIETLPPARGRAEMSRPMDNVLDVPAYLRAQGFLYGSARSDHKTNWITNGRPRARAAHPFARAVRSAAVARPDSIRLMSGSGPFSPIFHGVWQSLQPDVVTRYLPRASLSAVDSAAAPCARADSGRQP